MRTDDVIVLLAAFINIIYNIPVKIPNHSINSLYRTYPLSSFSNKYSDSYYRDRVPTITSPCLREMTDKKHAQNCHFHPHIFHFKFCKIFLLIEEGLFKISDPELW